MIDAWAELLGIFELIPEEVRSKVTTWSDCIDDWSVDGDFQNDTSQAFDVRAP
ncbi:MAG: hypothetical protein WCP98_18165 [Actinomycetes bacterium]